jgi:hypothetical protein
LHGGERGKKSVGSKTPGHNAAEKKVGEKRGERNIGEKNMKREERQPKHDPKPKKLNPPFYLSALS